jgi:hypothetical protein
MKGGYLLSHIDNDGYKYSSDKDVEKQTHRERSDTDKFSSKVKPTDKYTYNFLSGRVSMIVEEIVFEVSEWSFQIESCHLGNKNNRQRKNKSRREIRVYRTKVRSKPLSF